MPGDLRQCPRVTAGFSEARKESVPKIVGDEPPYVGRLLSGFGRFPFGLGLRFVAPLKVLFQPLLYR
jgi:hypothetical protein